MASLSPELLRLLRSVDTPTACNAIEVAQGKRGFAGFTRATMVATEPEAPSLVGYARTARIRGSRPSDASADEVKAKRRDYFRHMAAGPRPAIAVVEDLDGEHCVGAWWGEVHVAVHQSLGMSGAVTNGLVRDLGDLADDFPVIAGGIGVSHAFVHVEDFGSPVEIFGLPVRTGDLVHADRHGALVIPEAVVLGLDAALQKLEASEATILTPTRGKRLEIETLLQHWEVFEQSRM